MDSSPQPPVRIIPTSSTKLSPTQALDALDEFMADFQERSSPLKGGDNTVTVQLQKLSAALQQEEEANRSRILIGRCSSESWFHTFLSSYYSNASMSLFAR
ncbi:uncharacterized protein STEHIDRAFT_116644 [Stereum hirsutum FP-91666 SS1]|uniref:Uncharacterized protein n=1 Tax=Stereum hirsutum (strain FP-91666) TaxID=721885 RepID=R7RVT2_STEHR|nr:uncharacterized protein STEHIDRAFT_116644 [Stereum hirsutum FP-91666 SS1]EIM79306.1 hypothetical protein STEHIDRAFT_116644 [Stereum hirsutum FP-91666 SS1]